MRRFALAVTVVLCPCVIAAGDWPRFRGPQGNGFTPEKLSLLPKPRKLWSKDVGRGNASLVVSKGKAYTVGYRKDRGSVVVSCFDATTGRDVWERKIHSGGSDSSPVLVGDKLYVLCHLGKPTLRCLRAGDGKEVWARELPGPKGGDRAYGHTGSPLPWEDLIILNVGRGAAIDGKTGKIAWQHDGLPGLATPVLYRDNKTRRPCVLIFAGKELIARDARSGRELWSLPWKTEIAVNAADPIYHDGRVFITTTYGKHAAVFDVSTGRPEQVWKTEGSAFSSGFRWMDHVFCFTGDSFSCLEFHGGKRKWRQLYAGGGSVIVAGDKIILLNSTGHLWIAPLSTAGFRPVIDQKVHGGVTWTPPSLADGRLYVRNKEGLVVCLQIGR